MHWETLIRARALENQIFFIGVNRIGTDKNGLEYEKSGMVVDPKGDLVSEELVKENISLFTIDSFFVDGYCSLFPVKEDCQVELYKQIL